MIISMLSQSWLRQLSTESRTDLFLLYTGIIIETRGVPVTTTPLQVFTSCMVALLQSQFLILGDKLSHMNSQKLGKYDNSWFDRGRPRWIEVLWQLVSLFIVSPIPGSRLRIILLSVFGARIGSGVVAKPRLKVTFPWRLIVEDDCWIGECVWIDNLAQVYVSRDSCLSQGVYICTGNHDWKSETFDLRVEPVNIESGAWLGAFSLVGPGVTIHQDAVVSMGSVVVSDVPEATIVSGNPAEVVRERI